MIELEGLAVLVVAGGIIYATLSFALRDRSKASSVVLVRGGSWQAGHYEVDDATRIVVRKVLPDATVVDEHMVATIDEHDPDYDALFLAAMADARERAALFQSEE